MKTRIRLKIQIKSFKNLFVIVLVLLSNTQVLSAQKSVKIDNNGTMLWTDTSEEVKGFGVNYTVPFAHANRVAKRLGVDIKQAIDNDVYHFSRLGFSLYRVHVWDTQISDEEGNLIENEYLGLFDYLLYKLKQRNINYVITPIAFWGDGWPEPDTKTQGFSAKYGKDDCLINPEAIKAQENYLFQFVNHVNPYTELAYKDDPSLIAIEVSNEPHHRGEASQVTSFVNKMVKAIKKTGTDKPIFYNMSHAVHFAESYFEGGAEGGTFQWYPTGLGYQKELLGNLLPNVHDYNIPFDSVFKKYQGAKLVYEFDAADVGRSYIYPAMARSFRTAGIQIATHFSYDPTYMADVNTEYNTHYMNLAYTPQKAISLKICAKVFEEVPMYKNFGIYPENNSFGNFVVDYESDLAQYNTDNAFYYTNTTTQKPKNSSNLKEIAGFGNSSIAQYEGLGAYFLDKIDEGNWRLEVMPDAVWVNNPFGRNSPEKTIGVINWKSHEMTLNLNDLGADFTIEGINSENTELANATEGSFMVSPGTYMLYAKDKKSNWSPNDPFKTNKLKDFFAPESNVKKAWLKHDSPTQVDANQPLTLNVQYIAAESPESLRIVGNLGWERLDMELEEDKPYHYSVTIPHEKIKTGFLNYYIVVKTASNYKTYPANKEGQPQEWDFYDRSTYNIPVIESQKSIVLFDAYNDVENLVRTWRRGLRLIPLTYPNEAEYQINLNQLYVPDAENNEAVPIYDYSFKHSVLDKIQQRTKNLNSKSELVLKGRALGDVPAKLQIALVMKDGSAYGNSIELLPTNIKDYRINLNDLKPVQTVTLPRPYPSFLPYYLNHNINNTFKIENLESIQFSIGPDIETKDQKNPINIGLVNLRLE